MSMPDTATDAPKKEAQESVGVNYDTRLPELPWSRRIQIPVIAAAVYSVIRLLGPTLCYEVLGWQHAEGVYASGKRCIWAFWHRVIIPIVWWHRNHGTVVMNTTAFDGQWTRKVIEWLGFGTAQDTARKLTGATGWNLVDKWLLIVLSIVVFFNTSWVAIVKFRGRHAGHAARR